MQKFAAIRRFRWPLTGALLGALVFVALYGVQVLNPASVDWILNNPSPDPSQHYLGWAFFRQSPVHLPYIGANYSNIYPYRTSVLFTDSIPLLALLFKCLGPLLPARFQYFGWWGLACYALQGGFAQAILARLGGVRKEQTARCWATVAGAGVLVLFPALTVRMFAHTALAANWLVIAGRLALAEKRCAAAHHPPRLSGLGGYGYPLRGHSSLLPAHGGHRAGGLRAPPRPAEARRQPPWLLPVAGLLRGGAGVELVAAGGVCRQLCRVLQRLPERRRPGQSGRAGPARQLGTGCLHRPGRPWLPCVLAAAAVLLVACLRGQAGSLAAWLPPSPRAWTGRAGAAVLLLDAAAAMGNTVTLGGHTLGTVHHSRSS